MRAFFQTINGPRSQRRAQRTRCLVVRTLAQLMSASKCSRSRRKGGVVQVQPRRQNIDDLLELRVVDDVKHALVLLHVARRDARVLAKTAVVRFRASVQLFMSPQVISSSSRCDVVAKLTV